MTTKTKNILFFVSIGIILIASVYFIYRRSFVKDNFEVIQSEIIEEEVLLQE